jgi:hypothetical protein
MAQVVLNVPANIAGSSSATPRGVDDPVVGVVHQQRHARTGENENAIQIGLARFGFVQPHGRSAVVAVGLKKTAAKEDL